MENKLFDLAAKRRSVRRYTSEHIPDEVLNEIMKVALAAPCSFGHRPVEFVIVRDKIRELAKEKMESGYKVGIMAPQETVSLYEGYADYVVCVGERKEQATIAAGLYSALRSFDDAGAEYIYAESFRGEGLSYAIMNRLLKAAGQRVIYV